MVIKCLLFTFLSSSPYISTRCRWWGIVPMIKMFNFCCCCCFYFVFLILFIWPNGVLFFGWEWWYGTIYWRFSMIYYYAINTTFDMWSFVQEGCQHFKNRNLKRKGTKNFSWSIYYRFQELVNKFHRNKIDESFQFTILFWDKKYFPFEVATQTECQQIMNSVSITEEKIYQKIFCFPILS